MKLTSENNNIGRLRQSADIIEEISENLTYLGFCETGTETTDQPTWSILKIEQSGQVFPILTSFKWANGTAAFDLIWDERTTYNYKFKKFA